jgi:hypothetical protein
MAKNNVCVDLRKLVHSVFPNLMSDFYELRPSDGSDPEYHPKFNFARYTVNSFCSLCFHEQFS